MTRLCVTACAAIALLEASPYALAQEDSAGLTAPRPGVAAPTVSPPTPTPPPAAPPPSAVDYGGTPPSIDYGAVPAPSIPAPPVAGPSQALELHLSSDVATRLRILDGSLRALASRGSRSPLDGIMSIVSGGVSITFGVLYNDTLSSYLYLWGAAYITRGVLSLSFRPDVLTPSIEFGRMPMNNAEEIQARLQYGEDALEDLARRFRIARMLDASINLTAGLLVIPIYLGPSNFHVSSFIDYFVIVGAGISIISGIIGMSTRSPAERRWSAYREVRDQLQRGGGAKPPAAERPRRRGLRLAGWGAGPVRGGAAVAVRTEF